MTHAGVDTRLKLIVEDEGIAKQTKRSIKKSIYKLTYMQRYCLIYSTLSTACFLVKRSKDHETETEINKRLMQQCISFETETLKYLNEK